jgi:ATP synthase protein I
MTDQDREREDRQLKARLDSLQGRLAQTQQHAAQEAAAEESAMTRAQETGKAWSMGMRMVSEFVGGILVGVAIGYGLDWLFATKPVFLIIFTLLGTAAGFLNVIRAASPKAAAGKDASGG